MQRPRSRGTPNRLSPNSTLLKSPRSAQARAVDAGTPQWLLSPPELIFPQLPKEHIGILNGTSFSASVAALVAFESVGAIVLGEVN